MPTNANRFPDDWTTVLGRIEETVTEALTDAARREEALCDFFPDGGAAPSPVPDRLHALLDRLSKLAATPGAKTESLAGGEPFAETEKGIQDWLARAVRLRRSLATGDDA